MGGQTGQQNPNLSGVNLSNGGSNLPSNQNNAQPLVASANTPIVKPVLVPNNQNQNTQESGSNSGNIANKSNPGNGANNPTVVVNSVPQAQQVKEELDPQGQEPQASPVMEELKAQHQVEFDAVPRNP